MQRYSCLEIYLGGVICMLHVYNIGNVPREILVIVKRVCSLYITNDFIILKLQQAKIINLSLFCIY